MYKKKTEGKAYYLKGSVRSIVPSIYWGSWNVFPANKEGTTVLERN